MKTDILDLLMEASKTELTGDKPLVFKKIPRNEYDLACLHCGEIMGEKNFSFDWDETNGWTHKCKDGKTRKILPTEEQKKTAEEFKKTLWNKN